MMTLAKAIEQFKRQGKKSRPAKPHEAKSTGGIQTEIDSLKREVNELMAGKRHAAAPPATHEKASKKAHKKAHKKAGKKR